MPLNKWLIGGLLAWMLLQCGPVLSVVNVSEDREAQVAVTAQSYGGVRFRFVGPGGRISLGVSDGSSYRVAVIDGPTLEEYLREQDRLRDAVRAMIRRGQPDEDIASTIILLNNINQRIKSAMNSASGCAGKINGGDSLATLTYSAESRRWLALCADERPDSGTGDPRAAAGESSRR